MAARRARKASHVSEPQHEGPQGVDKLRKRKELFIQQFEKEGLECLCLRLNLPNLKLHLLLSSTAQERINEMEAKLDKLLATADRAFKIEMMKLPQSLHTTLMKDLMDGRFSTLLLSVVDLVVKSLNGGVFQPRRALLGRSPWPSR